MAVADDYRRQLAWRDWDRALSALPALSGKLVLDLGCGVGDVAKLLCSRGARVIGFDLNEELLASARASAIEGAEFRSGDLEALQAPGIEADGIWSSFAAAYFLDFGAVVRRWATLLRPGGFLALVEIDDLFAHEPLSATTRSLLASYVAESAAAGRYDFQMGRKLASHLASAGFRILHEQALDDLEFAFSGPARPDVLIGWSARLDRMHLLQAHCAGNFGRLREDLLSCLASPQHRSLSQVRYCIAERAP